MISAITSSFSPAFAEVGQSAAGLDDQLAKYQTQLSDWQNCASCKTTEGRAKIQQISDKISDIHRRMEAADSASVNFKSPTATVIDANAGNSNSPNVISRTATIGSRINVFA